MIKTSIRRYRNIPDPVHQRIKVLAAEHGCTQAAIIGRAVASFDGGYGCAGCGVFMFIEQVPTDKPPPPHSQAWAKMAEHHTENCKWIRTRGFQVTSRKEE